MSSLAIVERRTKSFSGHMITLPVNVLIISINFFVADIYKIKHIGTAITPKGNGIGIITLPQNLFFGNTAHIFHGPIPNDDPFILINYIGGIRQEINDIGQQLFSPDDFVFRLLALGYIPESNDATLQTSGNITQGIGRGFNLAINAVFPAVPAGKAQGLAPRQGGIILRLD